MDIIWKNGIADPQKCPHTITIGFSNFNSGYVFKEDEIGTELIFLYSSS